MSVNNSITVIKSLEQQPFTLALSSGFFGFYAHVGFMKALEEYGIKPAAYSGTSAGAIVAAASAKGFSAKETENMVLGVTRKDIWDPAVGFGLLRGRKLEDLVKREIGADFESSVKPLRIPVFDIAKRSTQVLTSGNLAQAIRASCAVPFMFHPVRIEKRFYWDGGVADKVAIHGIDKDQKILSHYLENSNRDPHSIYEIKRDTKLMKSFGKNLIQVQLENLPQAHPFAMHRGPEIVEAAYRQAKERLKA